MRTTLGSIGLVLALVASMGCSVGSAGKRFGSRGESHSEQIKELKAHIVELEKRAAVAEVEIQRLQRRLAELESGAASESKDDGRGSSVPSLESETTSRTETVDSPELESAGYPDVEASELPDDSAPGAGESTATGGVGSNGKLTVSAQALYDRGYTLFHRGLYVDSETAFQQFLRRFSATVLGDNAQFWIAEARYARGDVDGALAAYQETVTRFPDGNKVAEARLKIGDCLGDLGDGEGARRSYQEVIRDFPGSAAATIARERLATSP